LLLDFILFQTRSQTRIRFKEGISPEEASLLSENLGDDDEEDDDDDEDQVIKVVTVIKDVVNHSQSQFITDHYSSLEYMKVNRNQLQS
jgi:hypothetical protein